MKTQIEIHSGPDRHRRYTFTKRWDTDSPPYCSFCGGSVSYNDEGVHCAGYPAATPPRAACGASGANMPRGQVFFAKRPKSTTRRTLIRAY